MQFYRLHFAKKHTKGIDGIDFIENAGSEGNGRIVSLPRVKDLYVQAYAKRSSTEGRLFGLQVWGMMVFSFVKKPRKTRSFI